MNESPFIRLITSPALWVSGLVLVIAGWLGIHFLGDTDQQYLLGLSWRMFQGEAIYTDFDYVRPPLSPWLHQIWFWLPASVSLAAGKTFMVIQLAISSWLLVRLLLPSSPTIVWAFLLSFLVALHNFPAMPWHTVDGVFFGSIGIWLLTNKSGWRHIGWWMICLAALTKQSFFPLIPAALLWQVLDTPGRWKSHLAGVALSIGLSGLMIWWIAGSALSDGMIGMVMGSGSLDDVIRAGVFQYALPLIPAIIIVSFKYTAGLWRYRSVEKWFYPLVLTLLLVSWIFLSLTKGETVSPPFRIAHILFWVALWEAIQRFIRTKELGWLMALALAWCSSLSWGYQTPILVAAPLVLITDPDRLQKLAIPVLAASAVVLTGFFYPYRESYPTFSLSEPSESAYPTLGVIQTGAEITDELNELAEWRQQFPGTFSVLPNWPLIHALTATDNPLRIDWAHNAEGRFDRWELYESGLEACETIYVDKDRANKAQAEGKYGSDLLRHVMESWELKEEGLHFLVYQNVPKKQ